MMVHPGEKDVLLVDTSVWIALFRKPSPTWLAERLRREEVVTCLPVVQEVLQGFQEERVYRMARESMLSLPMVESPLRSGIFVEAAELYRAARRVGRTIRSSVDCLIAACAIRNDLLVFHGDRDFDILADISSLQEENMHDFLKNNQQ